MRGEHVTDRELINYVLCLAEGMNMDEIATYNNVHKNTVANRLSRFRKKLGCRTNEQLVAEFYHRGILVPKVKRG